MTKNSRNDAKKGSLSKGADRAKTDRRRGFFLLPSAFPPENGPNGAETGVNPQRGGVKDAEPVNDKLISIEDYQRTDQKLLKAERLLLNLLNETEQQRNTLASAMYVSPDASTDGGFCLIGEMNPPCIDQVGNLEMVAIQNRPEAYKAGLEYINSTNDLKRTITKYLPKATMFLRYTRDENAHLLYNEWKEIGVQVYFDLMDFVVNYWENKASKLVTRKTTLEMGAVALGITSQVRTAAMKYLNAMDQLKTAERSMGMSEKLLGIQRERAARGNLQRLQILESEGDVLNEKIEKIRTEGEAMGLYSELESAMGTNFREPMPH